MFCVSHLRFLLLIFLHHFLFFLLLLLLLLPPPSPSSSSSISFLSFLMSFHVISYLFCFFMSSCSFPSLYASPYCIIVSSLPYHIFTPQPPLYLTLSRHSLPYLIFLPYPNASYRAYLTLSFRLTLLHHTVPSFSYLYASPYPTKLCPMYLL